MTVLDEKTRLPANRGVLRLHLEWPPADPLAKGVGEQPPFRSFSETWDASHSTEDCLSGHQSPEVLGLGTIEESLQPCHAEIVILGVAENQHHES